LDELALLRPEPQFTQDGVVFHQARPDWLIADSEAFDALLEVDKPLSTGNLMRLLPPMVKVSGEDSCCADLTYPRRILAVDVTDSSEESRRE
jgi:hypothetical protein